MSAESTEEFQSTLVVRFSHDDIVIYANAAMARYLRSSKEMLVGCSLETIAERVRGEVRGCFQRYDGRRPAHQLVTDEEGRVFEACTYRDGGALDILLDEVTTLAAVSRNLDSTSGVPVDQLSEDELRTARQPERRFLTVMMSRLDGASDLADRLPVGQARIAMNVFFEEAADAVLANGGAVVPMAVDEVLGIQGAPRHFADHALRALRSACAQGGRFSELRTAFHEEGKELPPVQCGIWSGEVFVGTFGTSSTMRYSAAGKAVEMASRLARLARSGEILLSEPTLQSLRENLPPGWQAVQTASETPPNLSDFQWSGDQVVPLPEELQQVVWLLGPGVGEDASAAEFSLEYLWALAPAADGEAVPVLRAFRPSADGDSLQLQNDNVVKKSLDQFLGKYRLVSEIGFGGMGKVWKGIDRLGNTVAIKVLHGQDATSDTLLKRFRREAEIMARLPHRNICRIFEMSEFEGLQFIVMEFVEGVTLSHLLHHYRQPAPSGQGKSDLGSIIRSLRARGLPELSDTDWESGKGRASSSRILPIELTLSLMLKVCEAVQFAHEHGVLHRDLKPGNILLREDGDPLVADFGLAKVHGEDAGKSLSLSGHVIGTLQNMAPEQAESSKDVDERADIYSLGTILYLMLTGRRHFQTEGNLVVDIQKLRSLEPVPLRKLNPAIDQDLEIIVLKALRTNPAERYRRVATLAADIGRYRRGEHISARPVTAFNLAGKLIRRNRVAFALAGAFLLIFLFGGTFSILEIRKRAIVAESALKSLEAKEEERLSASRTAELAEAQRLQAERNQTTLKGAAEKALGEAGRAARSLDAAARGTEKLLGEKLSLASSLSKKSEEIQRLQEEVGAQASKISQIEKASALSEAAAEQMKIQISDLEEGLSGRHRPTTPQAIDLAQAAVYTDLAGTCLREKLDAKELLRLSGKPLTVLERISEGISLTCRALAKDYSYGPAWTLKGRYHLACMEVEAAQQAFAMAAQSPARRAAAGRPELPGMEDPVPLIRIADQIQKATDDRVSLAASLLYASSSRDSKVAGVVLSWLKGNPGIGATFKPGSRARPISTSEHLLDFIEANGGTGKIEIVAEASNGGVECLAISGIREISRLESLVPVAPASLRIQGAQALNWESLAGLGIKSLVIEEGRAGKIPESIPYMRALRVLTLKGTPSENLEFIRRLPSLEKLDVSGTKISDLSALQYAPNLHELDASGLAISNMGKTFPPSLASLTISPALLPPQVMKNLRAIRSLDILRAPDDPPGQNAEIFWKRWDAAQTPQGGM
ncbi:MAG: protein kinase [Verrucomicrobiae bacterium]